MQKVAGSRVVFIVGFERCATTSLAAYLVDNGYCSLLVPGIKEPSLFSSEPSLAAAWIERATRNAPGTWHLDASANYIHDRDALLAIRETVQNCRIIVSMRNQLDRTVSAFKLYRGRHALPATIENIHDPIDNTRYGDTQARAALLADPLCPAYLKRPPVGRYAYTSVMAAERGVPDGDPRIDECDASLALLEKQNLAQRVIHELRHFERTGRFPAASILVNSYFYEPTKCLFEIFETRMILPITIEAAITARICAPVKRLLGSTHEEQIPLGHVYAGDKFGANVTEREIDLSREALNASFKRDSAHLTRLIELAAAQAHE
jgi:hypothetical protein